MDPWGLILEGLRLALFILTQALGGSLGLGIISLSVLVRVALLPLALRAAHRSRSMREKMTELRPRLEILRERHAGDPAALNEALVREYRAAGIRPLRDAGFGLLAAQVAVGIALFTVISQGLGTGSAFLWVSDLARPDLGLAFIAAAGSFVMSLVQPRVAEAGPGPIMMGFLMAAMTLTIAARIAAGVGLYWTASNGVGVVQAALLRRAVRRQAMRQETAT